MWSKGRLCDGVPDPMGFHGFHCPNLLEDGYDIRAIQELLGHKDVATAMIYDAHFIGGGRHYRTWEVADIGLMVMFRRNGKIIRSKLTFLQSKKLFASSLQLRSYDPYHRHVMGRLLVTDEEHIELVKPRLLKYSEASKYKAFKIGSEQEEAMSEFSTRHNVPLHYLLYNPCLIPWQIQTPVEGLPEITENKVGCRVIPKALVDEI